MRTIKVLSMATAMMWVAGCAVELGSETDSESSVDGALEAITAVDENGMWTELVDSQGLALVTLEWLVESPLTAVATIGDNEPAELQLSVTPDEAFMNQAARTLWEAGLSEGPDAASSDGVSQAALSCGVMNRSLWAGYGRATSSVCRRINRDCTSSCRSCGGRPTMTLCQQRYGSVRQPYVRTYCGCAF